MHKTNGGAVFLRAPSRTPHDALEELLQEQREAPVL